MAGELGAALRRLWRAAGGGGPVPRGEGPVEALVAVVRSAPSDVVRVRASPLDDPCFFEALAFVPGAGEHQLGLAVSAAALVAIECAGLQDVLLLVDPTPDDRGAHRVYAHDVEALPGQPFDGWFPELPDALEFIERAIAGNARTWPEAPVEDAWERSARSGRFVLERVLQDSFSFWDEPPDDLDELRAAVGARHPAGSAFTARFGQYLDALAAARGGAVPAFAERAATDPTCVRRGVAAHARRWVEARRP